MARGEKLLGQLLTYLEDRGETRLRTETALAWATLPAGTDPSWWASRLTVVRSFATYLHTVDPATEIPPADLLRARARRATPYLYTDEDVVALLAAASGLRTAHRVATYRTLIGLLAVTGMRVGEAVALDRHDFDSQQGTLTVRQGKGGKSRALPLHPTATSAVRQYLDRPDRPVVRNTAALLVSTAGTRLLLCNVQQTFRTLVRRAGLLPHSAACRPRPHDLCHRFAVCTLLDAYRQGHDPEARLALLATYLGHGDPKYTYWYLSAAPELMRLATDRLERHLGGSCSASTTFAGRVASFKDVTRLPQEDRTDGFQAGSGELPDRRDHLEPLSPRNRRARARSRRQGREPREAGAERSDAP